tara:strand:- start:219 stop:638 length:420 start_codon:yes stop_codon:yes gene_type:complete
METFECAICLETKSRGIRYKKCGHIFCKDCVSSCRNQSSYNCALCRTPCLNEDEMEIVGILFWDDGSKKKYKEGNTEYFYRRNGTLRYRIYTKNVKIITMNYYDIFGHLYEYHYLSKNNVFNKEMADKIREEEEFEYNL